MNRPQPNPESGFALLFIYALAAVIAITLFMELPRVAFEAQRDREQLLIDRGEQYSRAVQLYVRKFNRYPPDFEALDNTQNLRFLRQRYLDPITGKDEWRLIHVGPGGVFIDSLLYNKKATDKSSEPQNFITEAQQVGGNLADPNQGVNIAGRLRPSDLPGAPGDPGNPQLAQPQPGVLQPGVPQPGVLQPGVLQPGLPQPQPGLTQPGLIQPGLNQPGLNQPGLNQPGLNQPGIPQFDANGQIIPNTGAAAQPPTTFPGQTNGAPAGANMIGQLLTSPRPGGLNGLSGTPPPAAANTGTALPAPTGQTIGGGIAGVASKREQEGIKVYKDKTKYNEWEFVYDITKDQSRTGVPGQQQQQAQQLQQQVQQQSGNSQQPTMPPPPPPTK